ncbi:unnamed protein product, partial [Discosporangium mesarthrocarpum]
MEGVGAHPLSIPDEGVGGMLLTAVVDGTKVGNDDGESNSSMGDEQYLSDYEYVEDDEEEGSPCGLPRKNEPDHRCSSHWSENDSYGSGASVGGERAWPATRNGHRSHLTERRTEEAGRHPRVALPGTYDRTRTLPELRRARSSWLDDSRTDEGVEDYYADMELKAELLTGYQRDEVRSLLEVFGWNLELLLQSWHNPRMKSEALSRAGLAPNVVPPAPLPRTVGMEGAGTVVGSQSGPGGRDHMSTSGKEGGGDGNDSENLPHPRNREQNHGSGWQLSGDCPVCLEPIPLVEAGGRGGGLRDLEGGKNDENPPPAFACGHRLHMECLNHMLISHLQCGDPPPFRCVHQDPGSLGGTKCPGILQGTDARVHECLASLGETSQAAKLRKAWESMRDGKQAGPGTRR